MIYAEKYSHTLSFHLYITIAQLALSCFVYFSVEHSFSGIFFYCFSTHPQAKITLNLVKRKFKQVKWFVVFFSSQSSLFSECMIWFVEVVSLNFVENVLLFNWIHLQSGLSREVFRYFVLFFSGECWDCAVRDVGFQNMSKNNMKFIRYIA